MHRTLPIRVGNVAKTHFLKSFTDEGFTDKTLSPWTKRKRLSRSDKNSRRRRGLLINKGHLRRSIKVGKSSFSRIEIGSYGIKYARFHNQGIGKMPKRQFIGKSYVMNQLIRRKIRTAVKDVFK